LGSAFIFIFTSASVVVVGGGGGGGGGEGVHDGAATDGFQEPALGFIVSFVWLGLGAWALVGED
jgi:hypothetical protein